MEQKISFLLNGRTVTLRDVEPETTLITYLRSPSVALMGTKQACDSGICGACTVLMVTVAADGSKTYLPILACRYPLIACDGKSIVTVEQGNSVTQRQLNHIQEKFVRHNATQCGFCMPGFMMSATALVNETHGRPSVEDIEEAMGGHLCRCTGFRTISDALKEFVVEAGGKELPCIEVPAPTEAIAARARLPLDIHGTHWRWIRPVSMDQLMTTLAENPTATVLGGASNSIALFRSLRPNTVVVATEHVPELRQVAVTESAVTVGAAVTLQELLAACRTYVKAHPNEMSRAHAIVSFLHRYRNKQNRCASTVAGELVVGTEVYAHLSGLGVSVSVRRGSSAVSVAPAELSALLKERANGVPIIVSVTIPLAPASPEYYDCYSLARRAENYHSMVLGDFGLRLRPAAAPAAPTVEAITMAFSKGNGWRAEPQRLPEVEQALVGKPWTEATVSEAAQTLPAKLLVLFGRAAPSAEGEGADIDYCSHAGAGLFVRFAAAVFRRLSPAVPASLADVTPGVHGPRPLMHTQQDYELIPQTDYTGTVRENLMIRSHATGMSQFTLDIPQPANGLYSAFVLSTHAHARFEVDATEALRMEGVAAFVCAKDIPGRNAHTGIVMDTTVFADGTVDCVGHPIGLIMAETQLQAELAAAKVNVHYTDLPAILSIDEAIEKNSYLSGLESHKHALGNPDYAFASRKDLVTIEGKFYTGGQEHFYLEGQNCLVVPRDDHYVVYSSTQNPSKVQTDVAGCLGIPSRRVTCQIHHTGGGFGGKQDRPCILATAAAVGAWKTGRPVRLNLPRRVDLQMMGGRHPFRCDYKMAATPDGKFVALKVRVVSDGGCCHDTTGPVLDKCVFQLPNTYTIPNVEVEGRAGLINHPTNTAFRGFGAPQHCAMMEQIVDHMALALNMPPHVVREMNMNKLGDPLFTGSFVSQNKGEAQPMMIWEQLMASSEFQRRLAEVEAFNRGSRHVKRGISITPIKNGVCFEEDFMNQAHALVHVLADGSVQVSHGGVEMGQGLNTKMAQIAAQTLGVPLEVVTVLPTNTDTCANTQPTAASSGTDLNGGAVKKACEELVRNLAPLRAQYPTATFAEICNKAYFGRYTMSATAHFTLPSLGWHWNDHTGYTALYYDYGASVSEVEVDCLTGEYRILRSDLLEDAGRSLNPALDLSQVEGAFMQGVGWLTMEEIQWSLRDGRMLTVPFTYPVPQLADTPLDLRTSLLKGKYCPENICGSKSTGEAPVLLATSVLLAIRHAIRSARADRGLSGHFTMDTPLTVDRIKLAIEGRAPSDVAAPHSAN